MPSEIKTSKSRVCVDALHTNLFAKTSPVDRVEFLETHELFSGFTMSPQNSRNILRWQNCEIFTTMMRIFIHRTVENN